MSFILIVPIAVKNTPKEQKDKGPNEHATVGLA